MATPPGEHTASRRGRNFKMWSHRRTRAATTVKGAKSAPRKTLRTFLNRKFGKQLLTSVLTPTTQRFSKQTLISPEAAFQPRFVTQTTQCQRSTQSFACRTFVIRAEETATSKENGRQFSRESFKTVNGSPGAPKEATPRVPTPRFPTISWKPPSCCLLRSRRNKP